MNASELIDQQIVDLRDWRGKVFTRLRKLIHAADPEILEEWKWNTAVLNNHGMVCAVGSFKDHVKVNFFKGAFLDDPDGLFNAGLEAKLTRAIEVHEGEKINESAFKNLIRAAVAHNRGSRNGLKPKGQKNLSIAILNEYR